MLIIFQYAQKKTGQACFGRPVRYLSYSSGIAAYFGM